jgi:hypothetical protein
VTRRILLLVAVALIAGCDIAEFSTIIVTAQVVRTLDPESNTASVLVGKATVANLLSYEWMETPEPGDTNFLDYVFPARIEPIGGATVTLNNSTLGQRLPGVYAGAGLTLNPGARYDLAITTTDRTITGRAWMPGDFALVAPFDLDSVNHLTDTVVAVWTRSESVDTYIVGISPADSASPAQGWSDGRTDTSCVVPASAFTDTLGNFVPGEYILRVTAVNGGWNRSALDLFLSGGNLDGAKGTFGCAVYPRPVRVIVR